MAASAASFYHCPRWNELPELALYMDQVRIVIGNALSPLTAETSPAVTSTMINNYVKMKLISPAEKKKYGREHIARLIIICLLKKVLSLSEIAAVLTTLTERCGAETGYDTFCAALEAQICGGKCPDTCPEILLASIDSLAGKLRVERLMAALAPETSPEKTPAKEQGKEKNQKK